MIWLMAVLETLLCLSCREALPVDNIPKKEKSQLEDFYNVLNMDT